MKGPLVMAGLTHAGNTLAEQEYGNFPWHIRFSTPWFSPVPSSDAGEALLERAAISAATMAIFCACCYECRFELRSLLTPCEL